MGSVSKREFKMAHATITFAQLNAAGDGVPVNTGIIIPSKSFIFQTSSRTSIAFVGNGDSGSTMAFGIEGQQDLNPFQGIGVFYSGDNPSVGPGINFGFDRFMTNGAGELNATMQLGGTDTALVSGEITICVLYVDWSFMPARI